MVLAKSSKAVGLAATNSHTSGLLALSVANFSNCFHILTVS